MMLPDITQTTVLSVFPAQHQKEVSV